MADYTAKSDFWFKKEDLNTHGINQDEYMAEVYKRKQEVSIQ
ncbi:MAG: hypothetical protein ACE5KE_04375 [Methanosarcinales archaeon]